MNPAKVAYQQLTDAWPDARRHPIVAESKDWEVIGPGLTAAVYAIVYADWTLAFKCNMMRVVAETIYCLGYERGKNERPMPLFVVGEE